MKRLLTAFILIACTCSLHGQESISGIVTDEVTGEPVPGAAIYVNGKTDRGWSTDLEGRYTIFPETLKRNDVIEFSYLGLETYKTTLKALRSSNSKDISLKPVQRVFTSGRLILVPQVSDETDETDGGNIILNFRTSFFDDDRVSLSIPEDIYIRKVIIELYDHNVAKFFSITVNSKYQGYIDPERESIRLFLDETSKKERRKSGVSYRGEIDVSTLDLRIKDGMEVLFQEPIVPNSKNHPDKHYWHFRYHP